MAFTIFAAVGDGAGALSDCHERTRRVGGVG
jgi:hypothetical protein